MSNLESSRQHRQLIQKLLVSVHYISLFKDEILLVEKTPSVLGESYSFQRVQNGLKEIIDIIDHLDKQRRLIESTYWYDEASFKLMNKTLEIVDNWIKGIDQLVRTCQDNLIFKSILGQNQTQAFGVLTDIFASLKIINLSLKEESVHPFLYEQIKQMKLEEKI